LLIESCGPSSNRRGSAVDVISPKNGLPYTFSEKPMIGRESNARRAIGEQPHVMLTKPGQEGVPGNICIKIFAASHSDSELFAGFTRSPADRRVVS
jgi:hypothetical protein